MILTLVSWNVNGLDNPLDHIPDDIDVALLQETRAVAGSPGIENGPGPAVVVPVSPRVEIDVLSLESVASAAADREMFPSSYPGTIGIGLVTNPANGEQIYVVSAYAKWEQTGANWIVSDASAHRLVSDLSALITTENHKIPIVVAGDWNLFFHCGETPYWQRRYDSVLHRMRDLGFEFVGPISPEGGIHRDPPPGERVRPPGSSTPTYFTSRQDPSQAWRQLDFVFASRRIAPSVSALAMNQPDQWGPSDHCRIIIEVDLPDGIDD